MNDLPLQFGILDLILAGFLLLFTLRGLARGLVPELGGLLSLLIAIGVSGSKPVHEAVTGFMENLLPDPGWAGFAAYVVVFIGLFIILRMLFQMLERVFSKQAPGWLDRGLGALAGFAKGIVACTIILVCLAYIAPESNFRQSSLMASYFNGFWHGVSSLIGGGHKLPELSMLEM